MVRAVGSFVMVGGWGLSKNVGQQQKFLKLHWLKRPKTVPKKPRNLDQKGNDSESWSLSFNSRFSSRRF